jgi:meiotic recombination protein DMC1
MLLPPSLQITVARAYTVDQQLELLAQIGALMAEEPFKLLIVDSIIANFRTEFTGRGELAERQQKLSQTLAIIKRVRVV